MLAVCCLTVIAVLSALPRNLDGRQLHRTDDAPRTSLVDGDDSDFSSSSLLASVAAGFDDELALNRLSVLQRDPPASLHNEDDEQANRAAAMDLRQQAQRLLLQAALDAQSAPPLDRRDGFYWDRVRLRDRARRDVDAEAVRLLDASWMAGLSDHERRQERRVWSEGFEVAERYAVHSTNLFPFVNGSDSSPTATATDDTAGVLLTVSGRYAGDKPLAASAAHPHIPTAADPTSPWSFHYQICSFENVCLSRDDPDALWMGWSDRGRHEQLAHIISRCDEDELVHGLGGQFVHLRTHDTQLAVCACFHQFFRPRLRPHQTVAHADADADAGDAHTDKFDRGAAAAVPPVTSFSSPFAFVGAASDSHVWLVDKYVKVHHVAHWMQKLMIFQSAMQHAHVWFAPAVEANAASAASAAPPADDDIDDGANTAVAAMQERKRKAKRMKAKAPSPSSSSSSSSSSPSSSRSSAPLPPFSTPSSSSSPLPAFSALVFPDTDSLTSDHEENILEMVLQAAVGTRSHAYAKHTARHDGDRHGVPPAATAAAAAASSAAAGAARVTSSPIVVGVGGGSDSSRVPPPFASRSHWFDHSGAVVWREDVASGAYITSLPPLAEGSRVTTRWSHRSQGAQPTDAAATATATATASQSPSAAHPPPLAPFSSGFTCFRRVSFAPSFGKTALHGKDTRRFRAIARRHMARVEEMREMKSVVEDEVQRRSRATSTPRPPFVAAPRAPSTAPSSSPALAAGPSRSDPPTGPAPVSVPSSSSPFPGPSHPAAVSPLHAFPPSSSCPPRRITVVYRHNRRLLNYPAVLDLIARKFNLTWQEEPQWAKETAEYLRLHRIPPPPESLAAQLKAARTAAEVAADAAFARSPMQLQYTSISGGSSSHCQQRLFASSGIIIAPHSSQLINVLFTPPNGAIIELTPEFHNINFATYAWGMQRQNFHYMLGGCNYSDPSSSSAEVGPAHPQMSACVAALLHACPLGDGACVMAQWKRACPLHPLPPRQPDKSHKNFDYTLVDLSRLGRVLDDAVSSIEAHCRAQGGWLAGFQKDRELAERRQTNKPQQQGDDSDSDSDSAHLHQQAEYRWTECLE